MANEQVVDRQIERYRRHFLLKEIGAKGQLKLLESKVLIIGAGGFGSPAALYLSACGVGTIGIADDAVVKLSNLQRQVIHSTRDIGTPKVLSARERMAAINPNLSIITHRTRVTEENILDTIRAYQFVLDCTDNFASKYLINDACILTGKAFSHAGVLQFEGQTLTVLPGESTCYRCIFPDPPPREVAPPSSEAGILGVLPGVIGTIQATEAIKYLLGLGALLTDQVLTYRALPMEFRKVPVKKNPHCKVCGDNPVITTIGKSPTI